MLFVVAGGVVAFAGRRGVLARGARRVLLPGPRRFCWQVRKVAGAGAGGRGLFWPEWRGGCTNSGYDKYHENYYYFLMAKMFSFLFIMLVYNSANFLFL